MTITLNMYGRLILLVIFLTILIINYGISPAFSGECPQGQAKAGNVTDGPTSGLDVFTEELASIDLSREAVSLNHRRLRTRTITIKPGGHIPVHSHEDRPALALITAGEVLEHTNHCHVPITHTVGDMIREYKGVAHWVENTGSEPAVLTVSDIVNDAGSSSGNFK